MPKIAFGGRSPSPNRQQPGVSPIPTALMCTSCGHRVNQPAGTRRTICPYCGGFFPQDVRSGSLDHLNAATTYCGGESTSGEPPGTPSNIRQERRGSNISLNRLFAFAKKSKKNTKQGGKTVSGALPPMAPRDQADSRALVGVSVGALKQAVEDARNSNQWGPVHILLTAAHKNFEMYHTLLGSVRDVPPSMELTRQTTTKIDNLNCYRCNLQVADEVHSLINSLPVATKRKIATEMVPLLIITNMTSPDEICLKGHALLLMNPLFDNPFAYCSFATMLKNIHMWDKQRQCHFMSMMRKVHIERVRNIIRRIHNFISMRIFPTVCGELPPLSKSSWWVPTAVKVLALFYAAFAASTNNEQNNSTNNVTSWLHYTEFYNHSIELIDLAAEYALWQNNTVQGFNFCQYPFVLSVLAKKSILQYDSEQKMIMNARRTLVEQVRQRETPDMDQVFLNISVRRSHVVADSLVQLLQKSHDFKKKLRINFVGEPGLDYGGVKKEWFLLMVRKLFHTANGLFSCNQQAQMIWFCLNSTANVEEYRLAGVVMGLAMYNSINLDMRFPTVCYKKLLSPPSVTDLKTSNAASDLGICSVTLSDLMEVKPELARGLQQLLQHEGNVEEDFCVTFQCSLEESGQPVTLDLKPEGSHCMVTNSNREEYVRLCCDLILNKAIQNAFRAFYLGFHSVCASNALILLCPEEVEHLVCGSTEFSIMDLKKVAVYDGYEESSPPIVMLWEVLQEFSSSLQRLFLSFVSGSDRIPVGGVSEMTLKITKSPRVAMLPAAFTCFNQLILPAYGDKKLLKLKLLIAMENSEGFGLQ